MLSSQRPQRREQERRVRCRRVRLQVDRHAGASRHAPGSDRAGRAGPPLLPSTVSEEVALPCGPQPGPGATGSRAEAGPGSGASRDAVSEAARMRCIPAHICAIRSRRPESEWKPDQSGPSRTRRTGRSWTTSLHCLGARTSHAAASTARQRVSGGEILQRVDCALTGLAFVEAEGSHARCLDVWDPDRRVHAIEAIRRWPGCPLSACSRNPDTDVSTDASGESSQ